MNRMNKPYMRIGSLDPDTARRVLAALTRESGK